MSSEKIAVSTVSQASGYEGVVHVTVLKGTPALRPLTYTLAMRRVVERAADQPPMKAMAGRVGLGRSGRG